MLKRLQYVLRKEAVPPTLRLRAQSVPWRVYLFILLTPWPNIPTVLSQYYNPFMLTKTKKTIVIGELTSRVTLIGSYSKNLNLLCFLRIPQKAKPYKWAYIVLHARKLSPKDFIWWYGDRLLSPLETHLWWSRKSMLGCMYFSKSYFTRAGPLSAQEFSIGDVKPKI